MTNPSDVLVFADTYRSTTQKGYPRFGYGSLMDNAAVAAAHNSRISVAFGDGHAALHTGEELNSMPLQSPDLVRLQLRRASARQVSKK